jgi:hypothetical protein
LDKRRRLGGREPAARSPSDAARDAAALPELRFENAVSSYLKVSNKCAACGEELHHHRADGAPDSDRAGPQPFNAKTRKKRRCLVTFQPK